MFLRGFKVFRECARLLRPAILEGDYEIVRKFVEFVLYVVPLDGCFHVDVYIPFREVKLNDYDSELARLFYSSVNKVRLKNRVV